MSCLLVFDQSGLTLSERSLKSGADVSDEAFMTCSLGVLTFPEDDTLEAT